MRNAADLDARAVILQRILDSPLDRAIVARLLHVDEVDDDQPGEVAQSQLTRDLVGGLEIGAQRGVLDIVLARRSARVDVDRDQRLGLVDDDVAARLQRHLVGEHRVELRLDSGLGENRLSVAIELDAVDVARHQEPHKLPGLAIAGFARYDDLLDLLAIEVADRPFDERAFFVDERRRARCERRLAHGLPHPQ